MAVLQTSLSSLGGAVRPRQPRQIAGSRELRHLLSGTPAPPDAGRATDRRASSPEWVLIQQAIDGNSDSQNSLFAAYRSRLYRTAFAVLRNKEDAEDALQDGLCNAHIHLRSFQGRSSFVTWLTRIVVNSALMIRRKQNSRLALPLQEVEDNEQDGLIREIADLRPTPEEICGVAEFGRLIAAEVGKLPAKLQTAFQLCEVDGLSITESSRKLGVGKGAFKSRLVRARQTVTRSLNKSLNQSPHKSLNQLGMRHSHLHRRSSHRTQRRSTFAAIM